MFIDMGRLPLYMLKLAIQASTIDVCSNTAVNRDHFVSHRGRLKWPHLHCRANAVV